MINSEIKEQIQRFKKIQNEVWNILNDSALTEKDKNKMFGSLFLKYPGNLYLIKKYLEFVRLLNDETLMNEFELSDISISYSEIIDSFKDDIDIRIEKVYFDFNVLNKEDAAIKEFIVLKDYMVRKLKQVEYDIRDFNTDW